MLVVRVSTGKATSENPLHLPTPSAHLPYDPAIPFPGMCPREACTDICQKSRPSSPNLKGVQVPGNSGMGNLGLVHKVDCAARMGMGGDSTCTSQTQGWVRGAGTKAHRLCNFIYMKLNKEVRPISGVEVQTVVAEVGG